MKKLFVLFLTSLAIFTSCEWLEIDEEGMTTEKEVVEGLQKALKIGADSASSALAVVDGYYEGNEQYVKIPLPEEIRSIRNTLNDNGTLASISEMIGLEQAFEDVVLAVNRAAEDAASDAAPILKNAITGLSISEGLEILNGEVPGAANGAGAEGFDSTAATQYLKLNTADSLTLIYAPKINESLGKDLVGKVSATEAWTEMTTLYNDFVGRTDVQTAITAANLFGADISLPDQINDDLGEYSTRKALDGLFYKVGLEEKKIRRDPYQWASDIIQKVFGKVN